MRSVNTRFRSAERKREGSSRFGGVDLYNSPANVDRSRSPDAPNMIRDVPGKVRKRMGYKKTAEYESRINGIFTYRGANGEEELVHAGNKLFKKQTELCGSLKDARSKAWQMGDKLFILDGREYLYYDGSRVAPVSTIAYEPKTVIARNPSGGGTPYEPLNLLAEGWSESFLSDGSSQIYQLSYDGLEADFIEVKVMTAADVWTEKTRDTDYAFDAALGTVTFMPASVPGASPVDGADNVIIKAKKSRPDYLSRINRCDMSVLYGVNAAADRLFATGNPDFVNYDWASGMNDAAYFPVTSYAVLGMNTRIAGYSIITDKLAAHKSGDGDGRNIILREGVMADGKAAFPVVNALQGVSTSSGHTIAYVKSEPLFLSPGGVCAITPADVNGERYSQNRSMFINSALCAEQGADDCCAAVYNDFYIVALGGKLYVLDSLQKSYEEGAPYSTHQYEAYILTGIDARVLNVSGKKLRFGTSGGEIMEFYTDPDDAESYNDEGKAISAHWDTPLISGDSFFTLKTFTYLALKLRASAKAGVKVSVERKGFWTPLFEEQAKLRYFKFSETEFSKFTFSGDATPKSFGRKIRLAKLDKARFRFENDDLNAPLGLYAYSLEYNENSRLK